ncbi:hypothetical protein [Sphingobium sp. WCS2017Hpa-17]|uniref:hypothetical protein n=1 Tax=Sphingobium sp. WCS2017Hpa-17 TaxID=3073638 RepID=UPI002889FEDE|nr:hypothetical protein [Sphingobium sp. WCS2017Hpa-17]
MTTDLKQLTIGERGQIMRGAVTVAQMVVTSGNNKQMVADRALFLAAPELLTALKACRLELDYCQRQLAAHGQTGSPNDSVSRALAAGAAAIAKAGA